ncbi:hypothetical protein GCM10020218_064680 [Dactylosporangium vinaceum]
MEASIVTGPPSMRPWPWTVNGSPLSASIRAPRVRSAPISGAIGRRRAAGCPSNATAPVARPATAGRKRSTVPARPTSTRAGPASGRGRSSHRLSSAVDTWQPIARRPAAISSVSRARSGPRSVVEPVETAPSTSARAVIDLEPGRRRLASSGPAVLGAGHGKCVSTRSV